MSPIHQIKLMGEQDLSLLKNHLHLFPVCFEPDGRASICGDFSSSNDQAHWFPRKGLTLGDVVLSKLYNGLFCHSITDAIRLCSVGQNCKIMRKEMFCQQVMIIFKMSMHLLLEGIPKPSRLRMA